MSKRLLSLGWLVLVLMAPAAEGQATRREPDDDRTFRPTVIVRKKASQGSGTVIASVEGETLILTAAHVVEGTGPLWVELHRYNFGVEKSEPSAAWPLAVKAEVAATDPGRRPGGRAPARTAPRSPTWLASPPAMRSRPAARWSRRSGSTGGRS